jgi:hypothetical protein
MVMRSMSLLVQVGSQLETLMIQSDARHAAGMPTPTNRRVPLFRRDDCRASAI